MVERRRDNFSGDGDSGLERNGVELKFKPCVIVFSGLI
jgi:hypothetical protein